MKNLSPLVLATLCIAVNPFHASAQEVYPDSIKDAYNADGDAPSYSQARSLTEKLPLDLMAVNAPYDFADLPVMDVSGAEIGKVVAIARKKSDQSLQAIINTPRAVRSAIPLDKLTLGALAYWDPAGSLVDQPFEEADFEPVSQYQAGHTAWGSLRPPTADPQRSDLAEQSDGEAAIAASDRAVLAGGANAAPPAAPINDVYDSGGASVMQLALNHPDAFQDKLLIDETGTTLGQIAYVARHLESQALYAVITRADGAGQSAVKLTALTVGRLSATLENSPTAEATFDESAYENLGEQ